ncbi:MAG: hypothetical protein P8L18_08535 [Verrucomicrobiota bacterium]|nr:hypothetical protein [Verrucomicrobiota bacterium]
MSSFEEKSNLIQLGSMFLSFGVYVALAGSMFQGEEVRLMDFAPLVFVAILLLIFSNAAGHAVVAIASRRDTRDERDKLIEWRATMHVSWITPAGVICGIAGLFLEVQPILLAHLLLGSLFLSEMGKSLFRLYDYRSGV